MIYIGIILICLIGTFLHFLYEISHHNKFVAIFAAVNESTWEHIKICMTPTILWSLYDGYIYGLNSNYLIAKSLSLLTIIILIPLLFYTYKTFTKKAILPIDVVCFYLTVIASQQVFYHFINIETLPRIKEEIKFLRVIIYQLYIWWFYICQVCILKYFGNLLAVYPRFGFGF